MEKFIDGIKDEEGEWLTIRDLISKSFTSHFQLIFKSNKQVWNSALDDLISPVINPNDNEFLTHLLTDEEIRLAVFSIDSNKAPRPDDFFAMFFKSFRQIIHLDVIVVVKSFFTSGRLLQQVNHTNIALIPMVARHVLVSQYNSISLCNVSYKIIAKILMALLKPFIDKIISLVQSAFVTCCNIQDNIIMAHEGM